MEHSFGRVYLEDVRDNNFPVSGIVSNSSFIREKYWWPDGWWGNQGRHPHCAAFSWAHWLEDGPVVQDALTSRPKPFYDTARFYRECQLRDGIPGTNYEGTTIRAGAKILKELGIINEYRWAQSVDDVVNAVSVLGPMVVGTRWFSNMTNPDRSHMMRPSGRDEGGHAYIINGLDKDRAVFRVKNSWGRTWADRGHAYLSFEDFDRLLRDRGEACIANENKMTRVPLLEELSPAVDRV